MEVRFLGSGGNSPIPMPTCSCSICREARERGVPYARNGNSMYLPGLNALVDAPEQTFANLNREGVEALDYVFVTHWHPDHVCGLRVVQARDYEGFDADRRGFIETYVEDGPTVVTTGNVYDRIGDLTGLDHWVENAGVADLHLLDEEPLVVDGTTVRAIPYPLSASTESDPDATGFLIEDGETTVAIVSDDARYLDEDDLPADLDLAVFECGFFEYAPDGTRLVNDADKRVLADELTHEEVLDRIDRVDPDRTVLTEIEHLYGRTDDDYRRIEADYEGVEFAYDGLRVRV